ncbi:exodeoxyribonuclease VII small subunit [Leptolyngbya ohadii]|uniref:exodeoxyribonuclease VII small subunit n=1 Tax=Leptolyngbya ohadii TaxID=1962290 RepID=UPI000B5A0C61|nr:exodeoxyribonuclease VII small subunit [Leptolyngbya ohadii]
MNEPDFFPAPPHRTPPASDPTLPPSWSYEQTVSQIEGIIDRIEQGELELADVFNQFATAVEQLRQCESFLNRQQQQVDLLIETLLDEAEPF